MAGGNGRGKQSEQQDWQRPAGAFSAKAKKDFLKWKRKQKGVRADQEEREEAQAAAAARGDPGGSGDRRQQAEAQPAAGRRKRTTGPAAGSNEPLHYVPLVELADGSSSWDAPAAPHSAAPAGAARLPVIVPDQVGFSKEGRALGMPVRPVWQGVVHTAEALHVLEEASFTAWMNGLQQRYGAPSTSQPSTSQPSSHGSSGRPKSQLASAAQAVPSNGATSRDSGTAIGAASQQGEHAPVATGSSGSSRAGGGSARLGFFETRLDFWRQLWRALEMSDLAVMIVDARCPLLHFSEALYRQATVNQGLQVALLLNKCDLVPEASVAAWKHFFGQRYPGITVLAASSAADPDGTARSILGWVLQAQVERAGKTVAVGEHIQLGVDELIVESVRRNTHAKRKLKQASGSSRQEQQRSESAEAEEGGMLRAGTARQRRRAAQRLRAVASVDDEDSSSDQGDAPGSGTSSGSHADSADDASTADEREEQEEEQQEEEEQEGNQQGEEVGVQQVQCNAAAAALESFTLEGRLQQRQQQQGTGGDRSDPASLQQAAVAAATASLQPVVVCVVGEPNVGKSSTLNALLGTHRLAVSSHPGRTKHYQTHFMAPGLMLCDSPGLVFPRLDVALPLQVLYGSFPIARCSDPYAAIRYLAERIWPRLHQRLSLSRHTAEDGGEGAATSTQQPPARTMHEGHSGRPGGSKDMGLSGIEQAAAAVTVSTVAGQQQPQQQEMGPSSIAGRGEEDDGDDEAAWTPVALCEALAAKRGWRSRRGGRLDTYRAANWLLRVALGGREGLVLAFLPPAEA